MKKIFLTRKHSLIQIFRRKIHVHNGKRAVAVKITRSLFRTKLFLEFFKISPKKHQSALYIVFNYYRRYKKNKNVTKNS